MIKNKQELKALCDTTADNIVKTKSAEDLLQDLMKYSSDGKTVSNAGMMQYCKDESHEFTKNLVYSVLCEVLDL